MLMLDMLGRGEAISVEKAIKLLESVDYISTNTEIISIEDAYNRVISEDIVSPEDLPDFSRATMDGYAVRASDTFGATETLPAYLNIKYEVIMGEKPDFSLSKGDAARIPTGGMLPGGADSVVMFEYTQTVNNTLLEVMKPVAPGENVIQRGEDSRLGEIILMQGHRLRPQDIGALAGLGIIEIKVFKRPVVAIISTGNEIVSPDSQLELGQVRDINSYNLFGLIEKCGAKPVKKGIFTDDYKSIKGVVEDSINDSHMVLISGGSSVGTMDMAERIIDELGDEGILFHGVMIKPGKPIIAGVIDKKPVFGLPGHPAAVTVSFNVFVKRVLEWISGYKENVVDIFSDTVYARLEKNVSSTPGRQDHIRVKIMERDGELWAEPILGKSGLISTFVKADGVMVIKENQRGLLKEDRVLVKLF